MEIGIAGLGRMGMNMARRLLRGGHNVIAFNRTPGKVNEIVKEGAIGTYTPEEFIEKLKPPRVVWIMITAGKPVDEMIDRLKPFLMEGDTIIDGGNSLYRDDVRRYKELKGYGIHYMDVGVSGGIWGLQEGYCLMVGGDRKVYENVEPVFKTLAQEEGYLYCGSIGAGHFVKMIHNGIEYGLMAAYGEGFELLKTSPYAEELDLASISRLWNRGSVIRSWLLELAESVFKDDQNLSSIEGYIEDSGEGRWTILEAIDKGVPLHVISASLFQRFRSRQAESFSDKVIAALRHEFGGHKILKKEKGE